MSRLIGAAIIELLTEPLRQQCAGIVRPPVNPSYPETRYVLRIGRSRDDRAVGPLPEEVSPNHRARAGRRKIVAARKIALAPIYCGSSWSRRTTRRK